MATHLTVKGQVTIPKKVRDALKLTPGSGVEFQVNQSGEVVLHKAGPAARAKPNRFAAARGKAQVKWRTDELMSLLRGGD